MEGEIAMEQEYRGHYCDPFDEYIEDLFDDEKDERCHVGIFFGIVLVLISGTIGFLIGRKK